MDYPQIDGDAIAVARVRTAASVAYTLYDGNWSQYVSNVGCIVVQRPVKLQSGKYW